MKSKIEHICLCRDCYFLLLRIFDVLIRLFPGLRNQFVSPLHEGIICLAEQQAPSMM